MNLQSITLIPVGVVRSTRKKPEDDDWDRESAHIELDSTQFSAEALAGLADFQRAKNRPNPIGTTVCKILRVEGLALHVEGLDAIDGSPVLDIKPWVIEFAPRGAVFQPKWISELMQKYWGN